MIATGIDLVEVQRIEESIARYGERFLARVFTASELAYCRGRPQQLAARFAAKEAVSKLLGTGIQHRDGVGWREIQIVSNERGQPSVQLSGRAAQRATEIGFRNIAISLSHTREHAIAMVVAE
ncbi:holo-[acyl-carrier protein] synthase [Anaerolineae bacterium]|nr:holo-[acyl-carrier protein] synthase [Anaerolineae bacterium]